ncbi:VanZ family protein [Paenibacillus sp. 19GGS1-52]|uniref:VanZ family protein n=1 Tax=Paenibacillus sp. 19GGS1-52 TaxID=2758563 RepID=UPI001EFAE89C|nr:VanZ family protein [Paenibacillus sp. 19GGS1-52]ULO05328.1 VanZ family protein [Paenibacillus sp. 19GGS1-52]
MKASKLEQEENRIKHKRRLTGFVLALYSAIVIYWMFIGFGREPHTGGPLQFNLIPLRTVLLYLDPGNGLSLAIRLVNLLGNVVVFIPFGWLLPRLAKGWTSWIQLTFSSASLILVLECLQMLLHVGSFDIDDLLLNLIGVRIGYSLFRRCL